MLIKKLDKNTFDVFGQTGFDNWTRVRAFHWGFKQIAGVFLPRQLLHVVIEAIQKNPQGGNENV